MPKAWLGELGARLPQIALAMLAAKRGGPEASAAFMQGLQQSADQRQQLTRQAQLDEERRGLQAQQMAMQERTLASQEARAAADDTRADDQQAFQRRMAAVNFLTNRGQELTATSPNAETGERQFSAEAARLSEISGIAPDLLHSMTPSMGPTISRSTAATIRRAARAKLAEVQKVFGEQATGARFADKELAGLLGDEYPDGGLTVQDLLQYGDMQATGPTGQLLELAGPKSDEIFPGTSEHAGRTRILRDEFIANSGVPPNAAERRAIDDQARQDTVAPVDPNTTTMRELNVELARQRLETGAANVGALPPRRQSQVTIKQRSFDAAAVTKRVQTMAEAVTFTKNLDPNTTNAADDQGLIYAFAKAMDPESVVREGEYATVQKYAQAWAQNMGFNAARVFSNTPFLTPQARRNMKATIASRFGATKQQYDNLRREYAGQIDKITGGTDGESYLVDYAAGFSGTGAAPSGGGDAYAEYLRRQNAR